MKAPRNVVAVIVRLFEEPNTCYMQVLESVTAVRSSDKADSFPVIVLDDRYFGYGDLASYWLFISEASNFFYFSRSLSKEVVLT